MTTPPSAPPPARRGSILVLALPDDVPEAWRRRGQAVVLVTVGPSELVELFGDAELPQEPTADRELIALIVEGHTQQAIARRLGCSLRTVQRRLERLRHELGVSATQELAAEIVRRGLG